MRVIKSGSNWSQWLGRVKCVERYGRPGCGAYHVRPRAGIVGMLMGWWQVKISSGCP